MIKFRTTIIAALVVAVWSSSQADPTPPQLQVGYSWTYRLGEDEKLLKPGQQLPAGARLALRVHAGAVPVAVLVFNSNRGLTPRTEVIHYKKVEANQDLYLSWKRPTDPGKAYVSFLAPDSPEANWVQTNVREWNSAQEQSRRAREIYQQVVLWKAEDKGAAVAGLEQHEVGAARPGAITRGGGELDTPPPPPLGWPNKARVLTWNPGQHPVIVSRFGAKSR